MSQRIPIYITHGSDTKLNGALGQIVRLLGLDSYGTRILERKAVVSLKAIAVLLALNFFFDLGAWWLLFNAIFGGGRGVFELGWFSLFAFLFSLLISTAIIIYEQQFMTTDLAGQGLRVAPPVLLRILVIVAAALITTQPVELMFFKGPIERRIHEESIRREAVVRLKDWQDAYKRQSIAGISDYYVQNQKDAEETRRQDQQKLKQLESALAGAQNSLARAKAWLESEKRRPVDQRPKSQEYWKRRVDIAQNAVNIATARVESLKPQIETQKSNLDISTQKAERASGDIKAQVDEARGEADRVRNWVAQVRQSKPGQVMQEAGGWTFTDPPYDFFEQLRVLRDLREGRPARWPDAGQKDRDMLARDFNFAAPADEAEAALRDAGFYTFAYWAVFGIAFVIPTLLLAFKMLQPQELREYYSRERQEQAQREYDFDFDREFDS